VPCEIIVIDDASIDGTSEMVRQEFPTAHLQRDERTRGYVVQRNRGAQMASRPIIFSIDDDAIFSSPHVVEQTLRDFNHPRIGVVAIPFVDVNRGGKVNQKAPDVEQVYAAYSYIGTAHALRRDLFLGLSGYREILFHQGEEEDYAVRLLAAGFITRLGNSDPVHHFESPRRSWTRMDYYGSRNKILYAWHNVPFPRLVAHMVMTTIKTALFSMNPQRLQTRLRGLLSAYVMCSSGSVGRRPVPGWAYLLSRELKRRGGVSLHEIEPRLTGVAHPDTRKLLGSTAALEM
jgi:glycosyltransferase involved in cell wall biosynthesis